MLLKFYVENYCSFKDEVCLDLTAAKSRKKKNHLLQDSRGRATSVLPLAIILGANGSGKTNLFRALAFMQKFVVDGTKKNSAIPAKPFKCGDSVKHSASRFEVMVKVNGVLYTYGFVIDCKRIHEEWLFGHFTARESRLFERLTNKQGQTEIAFGRRMAKKESKRALLGMIANDLRSNQLFLTEAMAQNVEEVRPIYDWFKNTLHIRLDDSIFTSAATSILSDGTKRANGLSSVLAEMRDKGRVYLIDELERSVHPLLCRQIIESLLNDVKSGKCTGQLIATSHQSSLLDDKLLRTR